MFIDGYLALCSAVGAGTATEITGANYRRQPIAFTLPRFGVAMNADAYTFGDTAAAVGTLLAGRAIYDAPTGGNLLLVLPFHTSRPAGWCGASDANEGTALRLLFDGLYTLKSGAAFSGTFAAGATLGSCYDTRDIGGAYSRIEPSRWDGAGIDPGSAVPFPQDGGYRYEIHAGAMTAGVALVVNRGVLQARSTWPASA